ncbi:hypothetical protein M409DRAFT_51636 [Zasmidium cellare ATCC 36951]|uniref:CENP-V/GFA domain-containing protein n=1 Tax=Zasmidium cellare ATCC 36951 TaxID=1080233 RepID=A0A6A6CXV0_ZASCE|nr:uncharacterized protein M409DRAFT_51636 [Zasmidium cellare ATCC 36951]KAF2170629.1 hypothetical protein M409DRAFT_51636 [Zasmidium cellare ATCC 36951]
MATIFYGSCLCKGVRYSISGQAQMSVLCHCLNCQKSSGSAFQANGFYSKGQFALLDGASFITDYHDSAVDAGCTVIRSFCSVCGSNLYTTNSTNPLIKDAIIVMSGCLEKASSALEPPQSEFYVKRRRDWVKVDGNGTSEFQAMS